MRSVHSIEMEKDKANKLVTLFRDKIVKLCKLLDIAKLKRRCDPNKLPEIHEILKLTLIDILKKEYNVRQPVSYFLTALNQMPDATPSTFINEIVEQGLIFLLDQEALNSEYREFWRGELKAVRPRQKPFMLNVSNYERLQMIFFKYSMIAGTLIEEDGFEVLEFFGLQQKISILRRMYFCQRYEMSVEIGEKIVSGLKTSKFSELPITLLIILWDCYNHLYHKSGLKKDLFNTLKYLREICGRKYDKTLSPDDLELLGHANYALGIAYKNGLLYGNELIISADLKQAELYLRKFDTINSQYALAYVYLDQQKLKEAYNLFKKLAVSKSHPDDLLALGALCLNFQPGILKISEAEVSGYFEDYFEKLLVKSSTEIRSLERSYKAVRSAAILHYLNLYYQQQDSSKRPKYETAARLHFEKLDLDDRRYHFFEEIFNNLNSETNKQYFAGPLEKSQKHIISNQNIAVLLNEFISDDKNPKSTLSFAEKSLIFEEISQGTLRINNYEEFKRFSQYPAWKNLIKELWVFADLKKCNLILKIINKFQITSSQNDSLICGIILKVLANLHKEQKLIENILLLTKIGPIFSEKYLSSLLVSIQVAVADCKQNSRNESAKNCCLLLYSITLLHVCVNRDGQKYQPHLLKLITMAKDMAMLIN